MSRSQVQIQLNYGRYIYISFEVVQGYHVISHLAGILYIHVCELVFRKCSQNMLGACVHLCWWDLSQGPACLSNRAGVAM